MKIEIIVVLHHTSKNILELILDKGQVYKLLPFLNH